MSQDTPTRTPPPHSAEAAESSPSSPSGVSREQFYAELQRQNMGPLWEVYRDLMGRSPRRQETPCLWPWRTVRPQLLRAGEMVSTAEAERRVLMFLNPGNPFRTGATQTLYAAAQLILPGESARAHRHSQGALRFIIEGRGAFTCVNGEKLAMFPGDLVLTPSKMWHDHGNEGSEAVMWLDGLDIPLAALLNAQFYEQYPSETQLPAAPAARTERIFGKALFPAAAAEATADGDSPLWAYRWEAARDALECLRRSAAPDPFDGHLLRYTNPASGGEVLNTMGCRLQLLPPGFETRSHRHVSSSVYHVAAGSGFSVLDGQRFDWQKGDTFAVPTWCPHQHAAASQDAVLFSLTDAPLFAKLGLERSAA